MIDYGFTKEIDTPFEETVENVTNELKKEDFGILTQINVTEKFEEKLGIDFKKYIILGACNPPPAPLALPASLLPSNVLAPHLKSRPPPVGRQCLLGLSESRPHLRRGRPQCVGSVGTLNKCPRVAAASEIRCAARNYSRVGL